MLNIYLEKLIELPKQYNENFESFQSQSSSLQAIIDQHNALDSFITKMARGVDDLKELPWTDVLKAESLQKALAKDIEQALPQIYKDLQIDPKQIQPSSIFVFPDKDAPINFNTYVTSKLNSFNKFIMAIKESSKLIQGLSTYMFIHDIIKSLIEVEKSK